MNIKVAFGKALSKLRKARGITQEDFSVISSRTYISMLERGNQSPTIEKIEEISTLLNIHPMTLLIKTYELKDDVDIDELLRTIKHEL